MQKIILATKSPYRREAFAFLGIDFEAMGSEVDESKIERKNPEELVKQLSKMKAEAVAKNYPDAIVIGMDSVGYFNGKIIEKPKSREEAFQRLKNLSGNNGQFYTGIHIVNTGLNRTALRVVMTKAYLRVLSDNEINKYLDEDAYYNTYALGFDPLGHLSSSFIQKIDGSYNNILRGIPLEVIPEMLDEAGYKNSRIN